MRAPPTSLDYISSVRSSVREASKNTSSHPPSKLSCRQHGLGRTPSREREDRGDRIIMYIFAADRVTKPRRICCLGGIGRVTAAGKNNRTSFSAENGKCREIIHKKLSLLSCSLALVEAWGLHRHTFVVSTMEEYETKECESRCKSKQAPNSSLVRCAHP